MAVEHDDFLALGNLIEVHLASANIPGIKKIYGAKDLQTITRNNQVTPSIGVVYNKYIVEQIDKRLERATIRQYFYTALSVRNASDQLHNQGVINDAGPMLMNIINALKAWPPGAGFGKLKFESAPAAVRGKSVTDFPLSWSCEMYI